MVPVGVGGVVVPEVAGFNGNDAQYFANALEISRRVSGLCTLPVFACAILSFCACGISFLYVRFIRL